MFSNYCSYSAFRNISSLNQFKNWLYISSIIVNAGMRFNQVKLTINSSKNVGLTISRPNVKQTRAEETYKLPIQLQFYRV